MREPYLFGELEENSVDVMNSGKPFKFIRHHSSAWIAVYCSADDPDRSKNILAKDYDERSDYGISNTL